MNEPLGGKVITIHRRQIRLQSHAVNKKDAIRQVGQLLVDSENIDASYIASMLGREDVANTYLGNGITIPHGLPKDRDLIKQTGIAVLQVPAGVVWNPGETAHLVVGIAAKSDEHKEMLRRLIRVLGDRGKAAHLTQTDDPRDIIEALTGEQPAAPPVAVVTIGKEHGDRAGGLAPSERGCPPEGRDGVRPGGAGG